MNYLIDEAIDAYYKASICLMEELGYFEGEYSTPTPAYHSTEITWKYVYLYNINGLLAKYNRKLKEIIFP